MIQPTREGWDQRFALFLGLFKHFQSILWLMASDKLEHALFIAAARQDVPVLGDVGEGLDQSPAEVDGSIEVFHGLIQRLSIARRMRNDPEVEIGTSKCFAV